MMSGTSRPTGCMPGCIRRAAPTIEGGDAWIERRLDPASFVRIHRSHRECRSMRGSSAPARGDRVVVLKGGRRFPSAGGGGPRPSGSCWDDLALWQLWREPRIGRLRLLLAVWHPSLPFGTGSHAEEADARDEAELREEAEEAERLEAPQAGRWTVRSKPTSGMPDGSRAWTGDRYIDVAIAVKSPWVTPMVVKSSGCPAPKPAAARRWRSPGRPSRRSGRRSRHGRRPRRPGRTG